MVQDQQNYLIYFNMKILSFGHIPSWSGGRQESGLANVIYQLALNMADCKDVEMTLAATDVLVPKIIDGKLTIYGWRKGMLIKYALKRPFKSLCWLINILVAKCKYGPAISVPGYFFKGLHLARTIDIVKPRAVHLHGMVACVYDKIVPSDVKIVVTMHGIIGDDQTIPMQEHRYKMERDCCHSIRYSLMAFIAEKLIDDFKSCYSYIKAPSKAILNAYDSKAFNYIAHKDNGRLTLVTIASFSENKGQARVIEAIGKSGVDCKYICIGASAPDFEKQYKDKANRLGVDFEYVGKKSPVEIREILANANYMILPSFTEGFGLVYLESIACGVPVILPKHLPIVQEKGIVQPNVNSLLLEDSSVESISKLLSILKNYSFDSKRVAESIIGYSWENIAKEYTDSFKQLII